VVSLPNVCHDLSTTEKIIPTMLVYRTMLQNDRFVPPNRKIFIFARKFRSNITERKKGTDAQKKPPVLRFVNAVNQIARDRNIPFLCSDSLFHGLDSVFDKTPKEMGFIAEEKYDGDRMQFHMKMNSNRTAFHVRFLTRAGFDRGTEYRDVVSNMENCLRETNVESVILDG